MTGAVNKQFYGFNFKDKKKYFCKRQHKLNKNSSSFAFLVPLVEIPSFETNRCRTYKRLFRAGINLRHVAQTANHQCQPSYPIVRKNISNVAAIWMAMRLAGACGLCSLINHTRFISPLLRSSQRFAQLVSKICIPLVK